MPIVKNVLTKLDAGEVGELEVIWDLSYEWDSDLIGRSDEVKTIHKVTLVMFNSFDSKIPFEMMDKPEREKFENLLLDKTEFTHESEIKTA